MRHVYYEVMKSLTHVARQVAGRIYEKMHLFTDQEAWGVYRFAAFVEAGFWGVCVATLLYGAAGLSQAESVVAFGRSIVGTAYAVYAIFVVLVARSMEWGIGKVVTALIAGIVPFGSLVFEYAMRRYRKAHPAHIAPPKGYDE